ncbi:uncharacterized protein TNCV_4297411 [Trichonephila clavipes]|nr:uncharacterized protein TNCV_4297411 [Trichonephila clavipes]
MKRVSAKLVLRLLKDYEKNCAQRSQRENLLNVCRDLRSVKQCFSQTVRKDISYPTIIRSAILPVPHGPDLHIPSPPDTLGNILDDLDQISHISSNSDDGYDPGTNDPELFSQSDLNDLERDLGLPKDTAEVLGSRFKERHLLNSGVSFSWY